MRLMPNAADTTLEDHGIDDNAETVVENYCLNKSIAISNIPGCHQPAAMTRAVAPRRWSGCSARLATGDWRLATAFGMRCQAGPDRMGLAEMPSPP